MIYRRSPRSYPRPLLETDPISWNDACNVDRNGLIRWRKHPLFVSSALAGEVVELERSGETTWQLRYFDLIIGELDERKIDKGIVLKRRLLPAAEV